MAGLPKFFLISLVAGGTGIGIGVIVGWGTSRNPPAQATKSPPPTSLANQQLATPVPASQTTSDRFPPQEAMQPEPQLPPKTVPQQANGLPLLPSGVTADAAGDPEVYKRLPGVPQPIINRDGRDMTAEVTSMLQVRHESQPFPGTANSQQTPAEAVPFPKTQKEMDRMVQELNRRGQEANGQVQQAASPGQQ